MRYLVLFFALALTSSCKSGDLYDPCESSEDCDPAATDACLRISGSVGRCTVVCRSNDDCGTGVCRGDLGPKARVCWPE